MNTPLQQTGIALPCPGDGLYRPLRPLLLLLYLFLAAAGRASAQPTLSTDLPDYPPGATVTLTGSGFAPDEIVNVQVLHNDPANPYGTNPADHQPWQVTAGPGGSFVTYWVVPLDGDEVWATLIATADGASSGLHAEVVFTDAGACIESLTGPTVRCEGVAQSNFTATLGTSLGIVWSLTPAGAGSISSAGVVSWAAGFTGDATVRITVSSVGCNGATFKTQGVSFVALATAATGLISTGATTNTIAIKWTAGTNATKYLVDVSRDNFATFVYNGLDVGNVTTATISGLLSNTSYNIRVRASNSCGPVGPSNVITPGTSPNAPAAPAAGDATGVGCTQLTANWSAVTGATAYLLDVSASSNFTQNSFVTGYNSRNVGDVTTLAITGLQSGIPYYYRVRASNSGGAGGNSNVIATTTLAPPARPGAITGDAVVCAGVTGKAYSVVAVAGATTYNWTLPAGATIASGGGTNAITVNFGAIVNNISVTAENACGVSAARTMGLTLNTAPAISGQPAAQSVTYGDNASFTVSATGTPAPTYQWEEYSSSWGALSNTGVYSGALTGTLTLARPGVALSGRRYRCIASNSCGTATTDESALLTVAPRPITLTARDTSKTYGDSDPVFTLTLTGTLVGSDAPSGSLTRDGGEDAGSYPIRQGTYSYGSNYAETFVGASLTIDPMPISIKADPQSKTYGEADPTLTVTLISGTPLTMDSPTGALTRAAGEHAGRYAIGQGTYTYGSNYLETFTGDSLTITQRPIHITADALGKVYGNSDPALTAQTRPGDIVNGDQPTGALSRAAGEDVGTYAIGQGTYSYGSDYLETFTGADFSISQRLLTINVTAGQHKTYGDPDPDAFGYAIGAAQSLATGDAFLGGLTRVPGDTAGTYNILLSGLSITNGGYDHTANYEITYNGNNFTIDMRGVTVTADAKTKVYGEDDPSLSYRVTSGSLAYSDMFTGAVSRIAGEDTGSYTITQGTLALGNNYTLTYISARLAITQRPITLTADPKSKVYGDADPALTAKVTGGTLVGNDAATGSLSRAPGANVGRYAILKGTYTYGSNYSETFVGDSLTISPRPITLTADALGKL
ncbi:MAG: hypothetical protein EOO11_08745 [Chitinophagaceae bacterium]|nr:MAG: hypothetical protein EOO11_08745 [Chitinophagaceae bacterium]